MVIIPRQIKIMLAVAVLVFGLGIMLKLAEPETNAQPNSVEQNVNILGLDKTDYDFGTISMKDGKVKTLFKITNTTETEQVLRKLYTSCMCTDASITINGVTEGPFGMPGHGVFPTFTKKLKPGEMAEIEVVFDPNAHGPSGIGKIARTVTLEGPGGALATMNIKANVTP